MTTAGAAAARPRGRYSHPLSVVPSASNSTSVASCAASVLSTVASSPPPNGGSSTRCLWGASQMRDSTALLWRRKNHHVHVTEATGAHDLCPIWRPARIHELACSIGELHYAAAVAIHHEKLEPITYPSREHDAFAVVRPRRPTVQCALAGNVVIIRPVGVHDKNLRLRAVDAPVQDRRPIRRERRVGVSATIRQAFQLRPVNANRRQNPSSCRSVRRSLCCRSAYRDHPPRSRRQISWC